MLSRRGDGIAGGKLLHHLDVGREPGAREDTLQEIVAEDGILRNLSLQSGLEAVDIVDSLAAIGTLPEQVLVDVGRGERIGIETIGA